MSLRREQSLFARDVSILLPFIFEKGFEVTIGEVLRPLEMQRIYVQTGRSKTLDGYHLRKLAIDLYFFSNGVLVWDKKILQPIGNFWESLDQKNSWGGNWNSFKDVPHFERRA